MRFALRNKQKIEKALSDDCLSQIVLSLKQYFSDNREIETKDIAGEPYPVLIINNATKEGSIEFYVVGRQYDVYRLAFKRFIVTDIDVVSKTKSIEN